MVSDSKLDTLHRLWLTSSLQDLTRALSSIGESQSDNLIVPRKFDLFKSLIDSGDGYVEIAQGTHIVKDDERPVHSSDGLVVDCGFHRIRRGFPRVAHGDLNGGGNSSTRSLVIEA